MVGRTVAALLSCCGLALLASCTTTAAKKALNKPITKDSYSGFDKEAGAESRRKAVKVTPVKEDSEPEKAVITLVEQLQKDRAHAVAAEEQLKLWGRKQGIDKLIARRVRLLLKHPRVEVRAPALRLISLFGDETYSGDLIECLADEEYSMRATAYRALRARTNRDFGFDPAGGAVARARSVDEWREWWQVSQKQLASQPPSYHETKPGSQPRVIRPGGEDEELEQAEEPIEEAEETQPQPAPRTRAVNDSRTSRQHEDSASKPKRGPKPVEPDDYE